MASATLPDISRPLLQLVLNDRVDASLGYMKEDQRLRVMDALDSFQTLSEAEVAAKYPKLPTPFKSKAMYVIRPTPDLRALIWYPDDHTVTVEDIVSHKLLSLHFKGEAA